MNNEIEEIKNRIKNKRNNIEEITSTSKEIYLKNLLSRVLITIICVLLSIIYINKNDKNLLTFKETVLTKNLSFASINNTYKKYFGNIIPIKTSDETKTVFNNEFNYTNKEKYYDGTKFTVSQNTIINNITSGIVVFIGEKENYGNTVIIQGIDGVDIWYGNVDSVNLTLYDYIEQNSIIGETKDEYVYFVISKDGQYLDYEEYTKSI